MTFKIINPIDFPDWNNLLLTNNQSTFFHTAEWARVLSESYNYKPLYFTVIENNKLTALIPLMAIKSLLTGHRGVSLPFTDYCPPIAKNLKQFNEIFNEVIKHGKKVGWKYIDLKGGKEYLEDTIPSETFLAHNLDLADAEHEIFTTFRSSTKRGIKKATKENVQVQILNSYESVKEFYQLNCLTRKGHGLPPQPFCFFKRIYDYIISKKKGFIALASHSNKVVAGAVYFHLKDTSIYKYGASDKSYQHLRPNNIVMWEAIKWYSKNEFKSFSFGRTEPDHKGLLQFKRGWGTKEETIHYYRYDLSKNVFVKDPSGVKSSYAFFRKLPLPLLKLSGNLLDRHVG
jgi:lipid II:glycine glycyltransferase (peptidoglycan interpeptide bridge formation enzyme)